jgi:hypothetical protein
MYKISAKGFFQGYRKCDLLIICLIMIMKFEMVCFEDEGSPDYPFVLTGFGG